jgi:multiple sugar transport system substrate-binding protein
MEASPIENFEGIAPGLLSYVTDSDGNIFAIPVVAYGPVLFYNTAILGSKGFEEPPTTWEEMLAIINEVAGRRDDGARIYGIRVSPDTVIDWARAYGGDAITRDFEIKFTEAPMIQALNDVRALYESGAIPPDFMNMVADDWLTLEQNGQVAFSMRGPAYFNSLNDPEISQAAGSIGVANVPASETIEAEIVPGNVSFWTMTIPNNSADPEAAWEVIRFLSSDEGALKMAINGQSPVKLSVYDDPGFAAAAGPWLEPARASVAVAVPDWPAFDELARVQDLFYEQVVLAVTGQKSPEEAMAAAAEVIAPLLPNAE